MTAALCANAQGRLPAPCSASDVRGRSVTPSSRLGSILTSDQTLPVCRNASAVGVWPVDIEKEDRLSGLRFLQEEHHFFADVGLTQSLALRSPLISEV